LFGRKFVIITYHQNWGEDRIFFHNDQGVLTSIPTQWTSLFASDPITNPTSFFRVPELLELVKLMKKNHHADGELLE
jgi:hypothetical protein